MYLGTMPMYLANEKASKIKRWEDKTEIKIFSRQSLPSLPSRVVKKKPHNNKSKNVKYRK